MNDTEDAADGIADRDPEAPSGAHATIVTPDHPLAFRGRQVHLVTCERVAKGNSARVTFARRAAPGRMPCPTCLPHGLEISA